MLKTKKAAGAAAAAIAAAALTVIMPTGNAFAIDEVECVGGETFVKVRWHDSGGDHVSCFANAGRMNFGQWVDEISTGNNTVIYYDVNGDSVKLPRWHVMDFNNSMNMKAIEIL